MRSTPSDPSEPPIPPAPPVTATPPTLRIDGGRLLDLGGFDGQPVVLAFLDLSVDRSHQARTGPALDRARAELRGLGAILLIVGHGGLWCFSPDDELELGAAPGTLDAADVEALRTWLGGSPAPLGPNALFVLDGNRVVRFARAISVDDGTLDALVDALAAAGAEMATQPAKWTMVRRQFLITALVGALAAAFADGCGSARAPVGASRVPVATDDELTMTLDINGARHTLRADPRLTLLDALRERLGMPGTKKGCDQGQCGACTVLVGGRRVNACLTLAVMAQDVPITTIEGVAADGGLHPLQAAFIEEDGFQCGYCTSGQIMSALGLRAECRARGAHATAIDGAELREEMSGNICRCGAYPNIVAAVTRAWKGM
jgi:xanthine dehydrogenase YagT iron-sulfur-binding subunit